MSISYTAPLGRAYQQMVDTLFRPFDLFKWLAIGLACWLARFIQGGNGPFVGSSGSWGDDAEGATGLAQPSFELPEIPEELLGGGCLAALVGCVVIGLPLLILLLFWLGSRGQFLFLDNVVRRQAAIIAPWHEYRREGNSLFVFEILLFLISIAIIVAIVLPWALVLGLLEGNEPGIGAVLILMAPLLLVGTVLAYVQLFTFHFVVPIMLHERRGVTDGWRRFLGLFKRYPGELVVYGLWVLVLWIGVVIGVAAVGIATCCAGFLILIIPYIGTVALLPVHTTFRGLGPAFLAQLDGDLDLLGPASSPPVEDEAPGETAPQPPETGPPAPGGEWGGESSEPPPR